MKLLNKLSTVALITAGVFASTAIQAQEVVKMYNWKYLKQNYFLATAVMTLLFRLITF